MKSLPEIICPRCHRTRTPVRDGMSFAWRDTTSNKVKAENGDVEHKLCPDCTANRFAETRKGQIGDCRPVITPSSFQERIKGKRFIRGLHGTQTDLFDK